MKKKSEKIQNQIENFEEDCEETDAVSIEQESIPEYEFHQDILKTIRKVRNIMKFYEYAKTRDELQKLLKNELGKEIGPQLEVKNRWNSILPMF